MLELWRHLFLPHHTNNFRAKLLHLDYFAAYVLLFFIMSFGFRTVHRLEPNILGFATDIRVEELLNLTNQKRVEAGLAPLKLNQELSQAAAGKAADMFGNNYWAHNSPSGKTPWDFINGAGYAYSVAGENLAKNFSNSAGVVDAWMNSPSHKENILRPQYADIGFAVVNGTLNGEETTLVVQMFGKSAVLAQAPTQPQSTTVETNNLGQNPPATGTAQVLPSTAPLAAAKPAATEKPVELTTLAGAVVKQPLFDIGQLTKLFTLGLSTVLMILLVIDGLFVWKHKIVRIGGRNVAHILFLFAVTGVIWFMSFGSIL